MARQVEGENFRQTELWFKCLVPSIVFCTATTGKTEKMLFKLPLALIVN